MKTKDITIGERYATDRGQVEVLEVGLHRRVTAGYHTHTSCRPDGVKVRYGENGHESIVQNRQIKRLWSEQVAINDAALVEKAKKADNVTRGKDIIRQINELLGIELPETFRGKWSHRGELSPVVKLHLEDLEALLGAIGEKLK